MLELVLRQQELRLRVMVALYEGLTRDPHAFWDVTALDLRVPPTLERAVSDDLPLGAVPDFAVTPPSPSEARAAAFYLLERGLCVHFEKENADAEGLMLRITGSGIDALEGVVLSGHALAAERPIGFNAPEPVSVGMARAVAVKR